MMGLASHAAACRTPRKRPPAARISASSTGSTRSPRVRSPKPTMPAATRVGPYRPLSLMAAMPATYSVSPTGRISSGPCARYIESLHEDRRHHVVAGADVGEEFVEQVAVIRPLPQMMMRVDDGQVGLEDGLRGPRGEPRLVGGVDAPELRRPP